MRVKITADQRGLKEHEARAPDRCRATNRREQHPGDHRLDGEQERGAEQQRQGEDTPRGWARSEESHTGEATRCVRGLTSAGWRIAVRPLLSRGSAVPCEAMPLELPQAYRGTLAFYDTRPLVSWFESAYIMPPQGYLPQVFPC